MGINISDFSTYLERVKPNLFKESTILTLNPNNEISVSYSDGQPLSQSEITEIVELFNKWKKHKE